MRKYLLAALTALSAAILSAPAEASNTVFVTYDSVYGGGYYDGYRGDYGRGYWGYYYDDGYYYRPRYRGYRSYKGYRGGKRFFRYRDSYSRGHRGKRFRYRY